MKKTKDETIEHNEPTTIDINKTVRSFTMTIEVDQDNHCRITRANHGMLAMEIIGVLQQASNDICNQMNNEASYERYYFDENGNKVFVENKT